jgi:hypothetical protein
MLACVNQELCDMTVSSEGLKDRGYLHEIWAGARHVQNLHKSSFPLMLQHAFLRTPNAAKPRPHSTKQEGSGTGVYS